MKFCSVCEKPLDFIEFLDGDVCAACRQKTATRGAETVKQPPPAPAATSFEPLYECELVCTGEKMELRSSEGWVLWSGGPDRAHNLKTVLTGAQRILAIRRKRDKS